ncbi:MAG: fatty acid desaturase, partial [Phenylobacterium sp.]|nr:fatty acid desaturase [Phenylobacterium sp.]
MAVAARVDPKTLFAPHEWAPLARRSSWKGLALIAHAWAVIFAGGAMAVLFPITIPLAIAIIG